MKLQNVLGLHQKVTWKKASPKDVRAKGVTLEKISYATDWWYERYINRAQKKIKEKREVDVKIDDDMKLAWEVFREAFDLMKGRNKKYGDSRKVMNIQAIANLCEMKLNRIAQLGTLDTKVRDEFLDIINYGIFALITLNTQEKLLNSK